MKLNKILLVLFICLFISVGVQAEEGNLSGRFKSIEEFIEYTSLAEYNQAPALQKMVEQGSLPPLKDRLPSEPRVIKKTQLVDGIGVYGGTHRRTYGSVPEGWLMAAGQTAGYGGTNFSRIQGLVEMGQAWLLEEPQPVPNLAKSWEWIDDGYTLRMQLMEGVKWSDGVEFTAEDILFTYYDIMMDNNIPSYTSAGSWTYGGELTELKKIDDYTIEWHFPVAYPVQALYELDGHTMKFTFAPAHVYKNHHPKYNEDKTYDDFINSAPPDALPQVVIGPYIPVKYETGQESIYVRNPYFWMVDEEGNQLPYHDVIVFMEGEDWQVRTLNVIGGSGDATHVQDYTLQPTILEESRKEDAHFTTHWGGFNVPYTLDFNLSLYAGIDSDRDKSLRQLFREKKFRQAIAHLVNREGIAKGLFPGPSTKPFYGGYPEGSSMYNEDRVIKYQYNPDKAKKLLNELGFEDKNNDGILNWPEGYMIQGDDLVIELIVNTDESEHVNIAEAIEPDFRKAGIDLRVKPMRGTAIASRVNSGEFEALVTRPNFIVTPDTSLDLVGPVNPNSPSFHLSGPEGQRELLPFEEEIRDLLEEVTVTRDFGKRKEIFLKILELYTENVYRVGIIQGRYLDAYAKRFRNMPSDFPIMTYAWTERNVPFYLRWTPKELQMDTSYEDMIPTKESYQALEWYREN